MPSETSEYEITVKFLDDGMYEVQVAGRPHPGVVSVQIGYDLGRRLADARDKIVDHRARAV